ncbi:MAG TPA: sulfotransferase [Rhizomicrobium sp.]|nr:sulfotransferase [Rhizomicrobium sp.]
MLDSHVVKSRKPWQGLRSVTTDIDLPDAETMMAKALRLARREAFYDMSFAAALKRLLRSYREEANLSTVGRYAVCFDIMRCLTNLLRLDAAEERHPAIRSQPITQPVFITGLPRSATTFLHTLLSLDPQNAVPRCWHLMYPYPPTRFFPPVLCRMQVEMQLRLFQCLTPGLAALHPLTANTPQECTDVTAHIFQSLRFDTTHRVPSYQNWLVSHGHHNAFRFHRRFLQHLGTQARGRHWILKSPDHVFALDDIRAIYPDAKIVFLHRDPLSVVASCSKLTELLRRPFARDVDRAEVGQQVSLRLVESAARMVKATLSMDSILHLKYQDVVSAPMKAVRKLYRHSGRILEVEAEQHMLRWLARQRRQRSHKYSMAEFGLDAGVLSERFAPYTKTFNMEMERPLSDYHAAWQ